MFNRYLANKFVLIGLGVAGILGLIYVSYLGTQTSKQTPQENNTKPKTAAMPKPVKDTPVAGQIIVKFNPQYSQTQITAQLQRYHASIIKTIPGINQTVVRVPAGKENAIAKQLQSDPFVQTVQRDFTTHAFFVPDDQEFSLQYALHNTGQSVQGQTGVPNADIGSEKAWDVTKGNGIKVAILDTGVDPAQPDLKGKIVAEQSFIPSTSGDGNGHGTHVAGIIAADTNNSIGIAGACPDCQLLIGKILDDTGTGTTSNATAGIVWAADQGAKVINMSLGTTEPQTASLYNQAVAYAMQKGAVVVAAAGNDGTNEIIYPAAANGVISVAATDNADQKASWSDYGTWVKLAAPGNNILSTAPLHAFQLEPFGYQSSFPYMFLSGTSMAGPFVSAVAALVASTPYGATPQMLINRLYTTADKINGTGTFWSEGRIDAARAVGTPLTATPVPSTGITPVLFCVGGSGVPPCATIPPGVSSEPNNTNQPSPSVVLVSPVSGGGASPSVSISPSPTATQSSGNNFQSSQACKNIANVFSNLTTVSSSTKAHAKNSVTILNHSKDKDHDKDNKKSGGKFANNSGGALSKFVAYLLQLLQQLLQLIMQCTPQQQTPIQTAPSPSISPATSISPIPSTAIPSLTVSIPPQSSSQPVGQSGAWHMIFDDEFNSSSLDLTKWRPNWLGANDTSITNGVNSFEEQCYDPKQITVSNGTLNLQASAKTCAGKKYASGLIESDGKFNFTFGYMEARIGNPGNGTIDDWPAFWADGQNWPQDGEIDVMEGLGGEACWHFHYIGGGPGGCDTNRIYGGSWHIYAADWEPGSITYYYDGKKVWQTSTGVTSAPMYLIANLAIASTISNPVVIPATMKIDYIRVWQKG